MKKDLSKIDLVTINCVNPHVGVQTLKYCQKLADFGKSILITDGDIDPWHESVEVYKTHNLSWEEYNNTCLKLLDYSDNDYVLVVQEDGHVTNPAAWSDKFFEYDYIGAPWPDDESWISLQKEDNQELLRKTLPLNRVGNGGFSLRSKKFLEFSYKYDSCEGNGEDCFLCTRKYHEAIKFGIKFAPLDVARDFAYENPLREDGLNWNDRVRLDESKVFGWHGKNFLNTHELMTLKES
tara:strand:- start:3751 stop:4461 length:711 start_codon:yes stop_codon:yes gene_type:complete